MCPQKRGKRTPSKHDIYWMLSLSKLCAESSHLSQDTFIQQPLSLCHVQNPDTDWHAKMSRTVKILASTGLTFSSRLIRTNTSVRR